MVPTQSVDQFQYVREGVLIREMISWSMSYSAMWWHMAMSSVVGAHHISITYNSIFELAISSVQFKRPPMNHKIWLKVGFSSHLCPQIDFMADGSAFEWVDIYQARVDNLISGCGGRTSTNQNSNSSYPNKLIENRMQMFAKTSRSDGCTGEMHLGAWSTTWTISGWWMWWREGRCRSKIKSKS